MNAVIRRFLSRVFSQAVPEPSPESTPSTEHYLWSQIRQLKYHVNQLEQVIASQTGDSKLAERFVELEADANRWRKVAQEANAHAWDDYGKARTKAILQELVDNL